MMHDFETRKRGRAFSGDAIGADLDNKLAISMETSALFNLAPQQGSCSPRGIGTDA